MVNMWHRLKLRNKFLIPTIVLILLGMGIASSISYISTKNTLTDTMVKDLEKTAALTALMLDGWLKDRSLDIENWAQQKIYIESVQDSFMGKAAAKGANTQLAELKTGYGYYQNIFLANESGDITAAAEPDIIGNENIKDSLYFKTIMDGAKSTSHLEKNPATGVPELILASRLTAEGKSPGVIVSIIEISKIDELFIDRIKVGKTGYAYLYKNEGLIIAHPVREMELTYDLSTSPDFAKYNPLTEGHYPYEYKGAKKWAAFKQLPSTPWRIAVTMDNSEVLAPAKKLGKINLLVTLISVIIAAFIIYLICLSVSNPINSVVEGLKDAAQGEGDLTKRLEVVSQDEVGDLAKWFNVFIAKMQDIIKEVSENAGQLQQSSSDLYTISTELSKGTGETTDRALSVASASEEMSTNMGRVATTMEEASSNVNMVASATEEMSVTISEIARNAEKARSVTNNAVQNSKQASNQVDELGKAAQEIGKVVEAITGISEQVNLLALNATIEAARAGEAGKGFAVVANEIKALAQQTAKATGEIKRQVSSIQSSTHETVEQIGNITNVVNEVDLIVSQIATAVEEQSATTQEIAGNVAQASQGIANVNDNVGESHAVAMDIAKEISEVTQAAENMTSSSAKVKENAEHLSDLATKLNGTVGKFII
ncbi:MAG: methyl-accepting chemotaxis protein [Proteobacteria bacterium]|nr:methyl-accepting chemotaxis protein [Pseudomonadota bacterium]MBU1389832.1 methyl-accepting chemotaxis protein [Pseudomonadota bacterium]MBU1543841.1 methyl-accepting chemotaxis protein [Pseudomonadota bacterium]MBU2481124.1 methyl-accepting chemotaxis protein [Pseudomonadota bacterium]